jgi:hypothetical protein
MRSASRGWLKAEYGLGHGNPLVAHTLQEDKGEG